MTHPHDTSTPTMSAESVPSEDLARRAVAQLEFHGANSGVGYSPGILFRYGRSSSLFVSELDASTLSASHLAKEGGEAGAVVKRLEWEHHPLADEQVRAACPFGTYRIVFFGDYALWGIPSLSKSLTNRAASIEAAKAAAQIDFEGRVKSCLASLPQPSPALAKGGDAVREALVEPLKWARTTDPSEGSVHYGTGVFGHWYAASRVKPKLWSVNHHIDGKNVTVGLFESLQSAYAAAQSDYDCRIRAALSTPTEGPASQTEGMGGDALREALDRVDLSEIDALFQRIPSGPYQADARGEGWEVRQIDTDPTNKHHWPFRLCNSIQGQKAACDDAIFPFIAAILNVWPTLLAALTPPETAEAGDGEVSRYIAKCREMSKGENGHTYTWWSRLADLLSTLEAERARADELRRERDFWENRENEALHRLAAAEQRAADALARAENAADWRPIEAAPKGRVPFLALNYDGEIHVAAYDEHGRLMRRSHSAYRPQSFSIENGRKILISETEEWRNDWSLWTRLYEFKPTHWRPLPFLPRASREAPPATDGGDNG